MQYKDRFWKGVGIELESNANGTDWVSDRIAAFVGCQLEQNPGTNIDRIDNVTFQDEGVQREWLGFLMACIRYGVK